MTLPGLSRLNGNSRLICFAQTILEAQQTTLRRVAFYLDKAQFYDRFRGQFNERQEKASPAARILDRTLSASWNVMFANIRSRELSVAPDINTVAKDFRNATFINGAVVRPR
ncbi:MULTISPECIES: hypothetical protein [unclassified Ensifer]|uniref:hypothetical protein n=1 Tax=unclassified Ensifer TaxID=2633371 RepID=UPI00070AA1DA|nr:MULTISPECIES: hypothetical protein [unclassified Ensifer]KQW60513.1 hypothetical protein ASD02_25290 [Ensifer sp. Root1252]KRC79343.1 hypothetical protein ASE32_25830 [Ensifer sp. Root231]KRC99735.1 hypothetical protein ASE47_26190 [Ensifer sp. Root258]